MTLGDLAAEASAFEVELLGVRSDRGCSRHSDDIQPEKLGRFVVPGGARPRNYTLRRLRPFRLHWVRVRALGPQRSWESAWSNEESFHTLSTEAARSAGHSMTADGFFVESERRICRSVCTGGIDAAISEATFDSAIGDILTSVLGPQDQGATVKDLLDARSCKGPWQDFVKHGARYSQPPAQRQQRMQRMRLVVTAKDLYKPQYAEENQWSMGPFYHEELGRLTMEAEERIQARMAALAGA